MSSPKLFQPIRVGSIDLEHRVVLAPLTRFRAEADHVPGPTAAKYYAQRSSVPGSLLISEGTYIHAKAGGYPHVPGIYNDKQIAKWKEITGGVHAQGSKIFAQLWQLGRTANPEVLTALDPSYQLVSASNIPAAEGTLGLPVKHTIPHALTLEEVAEYVQFFATAASNAMKAGFDGVEVHGANGYLVDQFIHSNSNDRTDAYGGSVENRSRFLLEIVEAISKTIGAEKTGVRLSAWGTLQDMALPDDEVIEQYSYIATQLKERFSSLAYLHLVEPRLDVPREVGKTNNFIRDIWAPRPLISAGGYTRQLALDQAEKHDNELIAFGRPYISNPDLPRRLKEDIKLTPHNPAMFYLFGEHTGLGYTDYEFAKDAEKASL